MKRLVSRGLIGSALWLAGIAAASAQYYPNRDDRYRADGRWRDGDRYSDPYYRDGDRRNYSRAYGDYRQAFYDRLQSDLDRAANNGYLRGGDLRRFQQARHEIDEFQEKWGHGTCDRHALDDAIAATQRAANLPGLDRPDRLCLLRCPGNEEKAGHKTTVARPTSVLGCLVISWIPPGDEPPGRGRFNKGRAASRFQQCGQRFAC